MSGRGEMTSRSHLAVVIADVTGVIWRILGLLVIKLGLAGDIGESGRVSIFVIVFVGEANVSDLVCIRGKRR